MKFKLETHQSKEVATTAGVEVWQTAEGTQLQTRLLLPDEVNRSMQEEGC